MAVQVEAFEGLERLAGDGNDIEAEKIGGADEGD